MEDKEQVECAFQNGVGRVAKLGHLEQHREKISGVAKLIVGIHIRQPARLPIGERRQGGKFADQPPGLQAARFQIENVGGLGIERR